MRTERLIKGTLFTDDTLGRIANEVYMGRDGDFYEECYAAADKIIGILREGAEAAARSIYESAPMFILGNAGPWEDLPEAYRSEYRAKASAALDAVFGEAAGDE